MCIHHVELLVSCLLFQFHSTFKRKMKDFCLRSYIWRDCKQKWILRKSWASQASLRRCSFDRSKICILSESCECCDGGKKSKSCWLERWNLVLPNRRMDSGTSSFLTISHWKRFCDKTYNFNAMLMTYWGDTVNAGNEEMWFDVEKPGFPWQF